MINETNTRDFESNPNYIRVITVRHPFARLLSGFRLQNNTSWYINVDFNIITEIRRHILLTETCLYQ